MPEAPATLLVVDDDPNILEVLDARLSGAGYDVLRADSGEQALERLSSNPVDLVVSDVRMPGMGGQGLLRETLKKFPGLPVVLLTAYGTIPDAVASIHEGAADYLTKPFDGGELLEKVQRLLAERPAAEGDAGLLRERLLGGENPAMQRLYAMAERAAAADVGVLILGESGTGKELLARALHDMGPRASGPFVVVDCGATPPTLLESELFGHVKGSFTHAVKDKPGLIEAAHQGTLFLDEIGNVPMEMQTRLLRFLQERTVRRVGGTTERRVDCRVIAATNADLAAMVRDGAFREDLYYRIKVVTLTLPPLRERPEDVPVLAEAFLERLREASGQPLVLAPEALAALADHAWPGNVRELEHALQAGAVFAEDGVIRPEHLQLDQGPGPMGEGEPPLNLEDNERRAIVRALERAGGVKSRAADLLGISRRAIHYKIKKYGLGDGEDVE